ncbi:SURF1 family protein [Frateuria defendens]|uniref:SURF1 family protein n=1 Tax=Frateuria defendens TaxID=2219559 RepID=UPI00066FCB37|nr:SURF1 family protein [Frateuria defendens]
MNAKSAPDHPAPPRGPVALTVLGLLAVVFFAAFVALGTWQVHRRAWKLDLIERVERNLHAPVADAPGRAQWPQVTAAADEYRRVRLRGTFEYDRQTYVWASTDEGSGYWVVTPLRTADGALVLVNRGFVPPEWCGRQAQCAGGPAGETEVTGLLRMSEHDAPLRRNDPARDSWYARDVPAIAAARGLAGVAPYFVDADAAPAGAAGRATWPQGGLTVVSFPNNHLSYLITWYALALMVAGAAVYVGRSEYRLRRQAREAAAGRPGGGAAS